MNSLENARKEINSIDEKMAILFEQRMNAVETVIKYKIENNLSVFDEKRELEVINKNLYYIKNEKYKEYYKTFIKDLMNTSKQYQKTIAYSNIVGYQGTKGAFSHIATKNIFKDEKLKSYQTFEDVFKAVENDEIAFGVLPFENSYTGEVGEVLDLLFQYNLKINKIYDLKISQNLLALPDTKLNEIKSVYSHHQALTQCKHFFKAHPEYELIPYINTALAAKYVSETKDKQKAAVASAETAKIYGLQILVKDINTSSENTTRFIVISKKNKTQGNRFNIMFTVNHDAGQLANIIQIIAKHGFNMESIKSRPIHNLLWQYYFYAELQGDLYNSNSKDLIDELKQKCSTFKVIGNYDK